MHLTKSDINTYKKILNNIQKHIWVYFDEFIKCDDSYEILNWELVEEHDFTNETNPETLIKVFKSMKNYDRVSVVKDGDKVDLNEYEFIITYSCVDYETGETISDYVTITLNELDSVIEEDEIDNLKW